MVKKERKKEKARRETLCYLFENLFTIWISRYQTISNIKLIDINIRDAIEFLNSECLNVCIYIHFIEICFIG